MKIQYCQVCNEPLIYVEHFEYDGVTPNGSFEPYFECPNGCAYPDIKDENLTLKELRTRNKIDTQTEFGIISNQEQKGVEIL